MCIKYNIFCFQKFFQKTFQKNFLRVSNIILELEKDFVELKHKKLKGKDVKIKREVEELFFDRMLCLLMVWISLNRKK